MIERRDRAALPVHREPREARALHREADEVGALEDVQHEATVLEVVRGERVRILGVHSANLGDGVCHARDTLAAAEELESDVLERAEAL